MYNLKEKIKNICKKKGISLKNFSEKLGISEPTLYDYFNKNDMSLKQITKTCEILDVPLSYFFDDVGDVPVDVGLPLVDADKDKKIKQQRKKIKELEEDVKLFKSLLSKS